MMVTVKFYTMLFAGASVHVLCWSTQLWHRANKVDGLC